MVRFGRAIGFAFVLLLASSAASAKGGRFSIRPEVKAFTKTSKRANGPDGYLDSIAAREKVQQSTEARPLNRREQSQVRRAMKRMRRSTLESRIKAFYEREHIKAVWGY
jgi:hypothetical protein